MVKERKPLKVYKIKFYKTEEHWEHEIADVLPDKFYSKEGCIAKCQDLLYRFLYYGVKFYEEIHPHLILGELTQEQFNRKAYKKQINENVTNRNNNGTTNT